MTQPNEPEKPIPPSEPGQPWQPSYQLPPGNQSPPQRSGKVGWVIGLLVGGVFLIGACVVIAIVSIGILTLLGGRVSQVFTDVETGIEEIATSTPNTSPDFDSARAIGKVARLGDLRITVTDAKRLTDIRADRQPPSGKEYWAVDVLFENRDSEATTISVFTSSIQDTDGNVYPYSLAAQHASPDPGLPAVLSLPPDATISGTLFYEIAEDMPERFWVYTHEETGQQAIVDISNEAR